MDLGIFAGTRAPRGRRCAWSALAARPPGDELRDALGAVNQAAVEAMLLAVTLMVGEAFPDKDDREAPTRLARASRPELGPAAARQRLALAQLGLQLPERGLAPFDELELRRDVPERLVDDPQPGAGSLGVVPLAAQRRAGVLRLDDPLQVLEREPEQVAQPEDVLQPLDVVLGVGAMAPVVRSSPPPSRPISS